MGSLLPLYAALDAEGVPPERFTDEFVARHIRRVTRWAAGPAMTGCHEYLLQRS